jgi:putative peptidoglycan lipid II flippase
MLYRTLRKRGQFEADARLRRRIPRLMAASLLMGVALYWIAPAIDPYLTGSIIHRGAGLMALVTAGVVVYAVACFLTGAFVLDDLKLLTRRARKA